MNPAKSLTVLAVVTTLIACSSSSHVPPLFCESVVQQYGVARSCDCDYLTVNKENATPNNVACGVATLGPGTVCQYAPYASSEPDTDGGCTCFAFDCDQDETDLSVVCGYFREGDGRSIGPVSQPIAPAACTGQHYCFHDANADLVNSVCGCQDAPCPAGTEELSSCTDATAQAKLAVSVTFADQISVTDCRNPSSTL